MKKGKVVAISAGMVDELGLIKAKIADLTKVEKALVAKAKAAGYGRFEGNLFEMNIFSSDRTNVDWKAIAEKVGYNELVLCKRNGGSIEDIRKANQVYISSRNNRHKAERDFKDWQQQEGILLFFDEARDIASRPHVAAKQMMEVMPKTLAPRLYGQPQKTIEKTLADWLDTLTGIIRKSI